MKYGKYLIEGLLLALIVSGHAWAQIPGSNTMTVEHPWVRATPGGAKTGAAYVTLINHGSSADKLLSVTSPVAEKVQFHQESEENGVSRMHEMPTVEIGPGATVTFKPGEMHIMLVGLKQPLKEGETVALTLTFQKAGKVEVTAPVAKVGAMQPGDMNMQPGDKNMMHDHQH